MRREGDKDISSLFTKEIQALEFPCTWSLSDTMMNRSSVQVNTVLCPLTITVSSEAFRGTLLWQVNLFQGENPRWLMSGGWWEQQGKSPGHPDLSLVKRDLKLIFYIPDIPTDNWLAGHTCCCPRAVASHLIPSLGFKLTFLLSDLPVVWGMLFCPTNGVPMLPTSNTKPEHHWFTPADLSQGQAKLQSTTWRKRSG